MNGLLLIPILLPAAAGAVLLLMPFRSARAVSVFSMTVLSVSVGAALCLAWSGERSLTLFPLLKGIPVYFHIDDTGCFFVTVVSVVAGIDAA